MEPEGIVTAAFDASVADSNLIRHAERELRLAGMYDADADYGGGAIAECVLELIEVLARQEHSGGSVGMVLTIFGRLAQFRPLTPNDHRAYQDVSELSGYPLLQDTRDSRWFSKDGGQHWYNVDTYRGTWRDRVMFWATCKWERWQRGRQR